MNDEHVVLNVHMEAAPGRETDLEHVLRSLVAPTRKEPGCLVYRLHRDPQHAGKFMFYERFASQAALDAHLASPHFQAFLKFRAAPDPVAAMNVTTWREIEP